LRVNLFFYFFYFSKEKMDIAKEIGLGLAGNAGTVVETTAEYFQAPAAAAQVARAQATQAGAAPPVVAPTAPKAPVAKKQVSTLRRIVNFLIGIIACH
jgi:hypothetical protein